jgi:hypothetical protein
MCVTALQCQWPSPHANRRSATQEHTIQPDGLSILRQKNPLHITASLITAAAEMLSTLKIIIIIIY